MKTPSREAIALEKKLRQIMGITEYGVLQRQKIIQSAIEEAYAKGHLDGRLRDSTSSESRAARPKEMTDIQIAQMLQCSKPELVAEIERLRATQPQEDKLRRCQSKKKYRGVIVQCEGGEGHDTPHYNFNIWWPLK